jgi:hypothetical protein
MTAPPLNVPYPTGFRLTGSLRWRDPETGRMFVMAQPSAEPDLWTQYLAGAERTYRKYGVECALELDTIRNGLDTVLFVTALDETERVAGGLRVKGPYRSSDDSHAVVEWDSQPGLPAVRKMITDRLPFGVVEVKAAWAADESPQNRSLTKPLGRTGAYAAALMGVQFVMVTAAAHVLEQWRSLGGVVASNVPAAPYPDERYRTKLMFWDRHNFVKHAEPRQGSKMLQEMKMLQAMSGSIRLSHAQVYAMPGTRL